MKARSLIVILAAMHGIAGVLCAEEKSAAPLKFDELNDQFNDSVSTAGALFRQRLPEALAAASGWKRNFPVRRTFPVRHPNER